MNHPESSPVQPEGAPGFTLGKRVATGFSLALVGAVLWPIHQNWRKHPKDDFPLSYYPMFSAKRSAIETFYYVLGRDDEDGRHPISHKIIGDGGGNQVRRQLRKIINEGRAPELARTVAKRIARKDQPPLSQIASVSVVTGKYSVDGYFHGRKEPVSEKISAVAQVERKNAVAQVERRTQ